MAASTLRSAISPQPCALPQPAASTQEYMSPLEKIPSEMRRKIFTHLLKADSVRQPPDRYLVCPYRFHTAVLSVSKKIHDDAHDMLYRENHFVTISSNWEMIFTCMTNHEVTTVCQKPQLVARFKNNIMRLHVKFPWANTQGNSKVLASFLMLTQDLPGFTRLLHILDITNSGLRPQLNFNFRIESMDADPPSLALQKTLLEPFRCLTTGEKNVKFNGNVDAAYAQDLSKAMMPPLHWVRAAAWKLYYTGVSIKRVGDQALRMGNYDLAFAKYEDCQNVFKTAQANNENIFEIEDAGFHASSDRLISICETNILLSALKAGEDPKEPEMTPLEAAGFVLKFAAIQYIEATDRASQLSLLQKSKLYHYGGIAYAIKGNDNAALIQFRKAAQLDPVGDQHIRLDLAITARRRAAKSLKEKNAAGKVKASRLKDEPLELENPIFTTSECINGERYLLRKFGYHGDMLEHIQGSKGVDIEEMDQVVKDMEKEKATIKKSNMTGLWIGGGLKLKEQRSTGVGLQLDPITNSMRVVRF